MKNVHAMDSLEDVHKSQYTDQPTHMDQLQETDKEQYMDTSPPNSSGLIDQVMISPDNSTENIDNPLGINTAHAMDSLEDVDKLQYMDQLQETDKDHYMDISLPSSPLTMFSDDNVDLKDMGTMAIESEKIVRHSSRLRIAASLRNNTVPHTHHSQFEDFGLANNPIDLTGLMPKWVGDLLVEYIDLTADSVCSASYLVPCVITKYIEVRKTFLSQIFSW